jgi:DNA-binding XRE family transcriptional regulator
MKQVELARRLGVSKACITMLIKVQRQPSKKLQKKINKLTKECSLPDILSGLNGVQVVGGSNPCTLIFIYSRLFTPEKLHFSGGIR